MKLRTHIEIRPFDFRLSYADRGLCVGSCFADRMGQRMVERRMGVLVNPFGILFNPASVAGALERCHARKRFREEELTLSGSMWVSFDCHGSFAETEPGRLLERINEALERGAQTLGEATYVVATWGTAWVYEQVASGCVVSNCHKLPARDFTRRALTVDEIVARWEHLLETALRGKRLILTVSPIRHLGDGLTENSLSKATLLVAAHTLRERHPDQVFYFPAYEIMLDDLRDYRFYARDLVHPSDLAEEYIWEQFCTCTIDKELVNDIFPRLEALSRAAAHRPLHPDSEAHRLHQADLQRRQQQLDEELQILNHKPHNS